MPDCASIDPFVTPYVDGELAAPDCQAVEQHVRVCPPCRARVAAEEAARDLLRSRRAALHAERAPDGLRARCAAARLAATPAAVAGRTVRSWRARLAPLAIAAMLVLLVGGAFLYRLTQTSVRVMAAELAVDHVKCFMMNAVLGTRQAQEAVESSLAASFGWQAHLPERPDQAELELVGARPCLYAEGRIAHIMYRYQGRPVSIFMLPKKSRPEEFVDIIGHEAAIWSEGGRTFVLVARESRADVERIASFVHRTLR